MSSHSFRNIGRFGTVFQKNGFLVFCIVLTLAYAVLVLSANYSHFPFQGPIEFLSVVLHWFVSALGIFCIIFILGLNRYLFLVLFPIFFISMGATAFFIWQFDVSINPALIESVSMTNSGEIGNYISLWLVVIVAVAAALSFVAVYFRFRVKMNLRQFIWGSILFAIGLTAFQITDSLNNRSLVVRSPFSFYRATQKYLFERRELQGNRAMIGNDAVALADSMTTIVIIGEALRADHLQMNGYERITMPRVEKKGVITLPYMRSPYTHTAQSIPYMLTRASESLLDPATSESSFINAFKRASFGTAWLGNQNPIENFRFFIGECDTFIINKPQLSDYSNSKRYDSDLLPHIYSILGRGPTKQLVVVHLLGNHWWYNNNMPDSFAVFRPILQSKIISETNRQRMINSYDNVTLFTDSVIEKIIESIEGKTALLIFLADHGQSFGEEGKWLHANDTEAEKNPACFVWFSDRYREQFPEKVKNLQANRLRAINTDFLFHSILCGSEIQTEAMNPALCVFSDQFRPSKGESD